MFVTNVVTTLAAETHHITSQHITNTYIYTASKCMYTAQYYKYSVHRKKNYKNRWQQNMTSPTPHDHFLFEMNRN